MVGGDADSSSSVENITPTTNTSDYTYTSATYLKIGKVIIIDVVFTMKSSMSTIGESNWLLRDIPDPQNPLLYPISVNASGSYYYNSTANFGLVTLYKLSSRSNTSLGGTIFPERSGTTTTAEKSTTWRLHMTYACK